MEIKRVHCFFEQSGTFKNEFKKLGIDALDYDIVNQFGQTDKQCDIFKEIQLAYNSEKNWTIFQNISKKDLIFAFFPCIRFETQIELWFRGTVYSMKDWLDVEKLEYALKPHKELDYFYEIITKLAIVAIKKGLKLIIENPYSTTHYLTKYWPIKAKIIDRDRILRGDSFVKPTQYWFINCEPENNLVMEPLLYKEIKKVIKTSNQVERSIIDAEYARRFIKEFLINK